MKENRATRQSRPLALLFCLVQGFSLILVAAYDAIGLEEWLEDRLQSAAFQLREPNPSPSTRVIALRMTPSDTYTTSREALVSFLEDMAGLPTSQQPDAIAIDLLLYSPESNTTDPMMERLISAQEKLGNVINAYAAAYVSQPLPLPLKHNHSLLAKLIEPSRLEGAPSRATVFSTVYPANPQFARRLYESSAGLGFVNMLPEDRTKRIGLFSMPMVSTWHPTTYNSRGGISTRGEMTYQSLALAAAQVALHKRTPQSSTVSMQAGQLHVQSKLGYSFILPTTLTVNHRPPHSGYINSNLSGYFYAYSATTGSLNSLADSSCLVLPRHKQDEPSESSGPVSASPSPQAIECNKSPNFSGLVLVVVDGRERQTVQDPLHGRFPGSIHASAIEDILSGDLLSHPSQRSTWLITLLCMVLAFWTRSQTLAKLIGQQSRLSFQVWKAFQVLPMGEALIIATYAILSFISLEQWSVWPSPAKPALATGSNWLSWSVVTGIWLRINSEHSQKAHLKIKQNQEATAAALALVEHKARECSPLTLTSVDRLESGFTGDTQQTEEPSPSIDELSVNAQRYYTQIAASVRNGEVHIQELPTAEEVSTTHLLDSDQRAISELRQTLIHLQHENQTLSEKVNPRQLPPILAQTRNTNLNERKDSLERTWQALSNQQVQQQQLKAKLTFTEKQGKEAIQQLQSVGIVSTSQSYSFQLLHEIQKSSRFTFPTVITGETGTGKELVARAIHKLGTRAHGPFIAINCAELDGQLAASRLFGHKKGSFTGAIADHKGAFEIANEGVLFLDELHHLAREVQVSLLRVLQEWRVSPIGGTEKAKLDVHLLVATNIDLFGLSNHARIEHDLAARLRNHFISLPPLRERRSDIGPLFTYFLQQFSKQHKVAQFSVDKAVYPELQTWYWPDNIRGLQNFTEQLAANVVLGLGDNNPDRLNINLDHIQRLITQPNFRHFRTGKQTQLPGSVDTEVSTSIESDDRRVFGTRLAVRLPVYRRGEFRWSQIQDTRIKRGESCPSSKGTFYKDLYKAWVLAIIESGGSEERIMELLCRGDLNDSVRTEQLHKSLSKWKALMQTADHWKEHNSIGIDSTTMEPTTFHSLEKALAVDLYGDPTCAKLAAKLVTSTWSGRIKVPKSSSAKLPIENCVEY